MPLTRAQRERIEREMPLVIDLSMLPAPGTKPKCEETAMGGGSVSYGSSNSAGVASINAGGRHVCTVPGHRCMVSPAPRAPWWRTERAYRRSGFERFTLPPHPAERVGVVALWLGALYVAGHVVAWVLR